jgi:hypothetical protein
LTRRFFEHVNEFGVGGDRFSKSQKCLEMSCQALGPANLGMLVTSGAEPRLCRRALSALKVDRLAANVVNCIGLRRL